MSGPWLAATNPRHPWLRTLQYGLLWAAATTGMESVLLPVRDMPTDVMLWFLLGIGMQWGVVGVLAANVAVVAERRLTPWTLVALALLSPFVLAFVLILFLAGAPSTRAEGYAILFPGGVDLGAIYVYAAWMMLFYGNLLLFGCVLATRFERAGRIFGDAEIARSRTKALLGETELQALQGRVDPGLLHDVMAEVQRRYALDPAHADRLLDELVNFLRRAMPGLRNESSTLSAEIQLAEAYASLLAEFKPRSARWHVHRGADLPECPFPPLLLLPVLDRMSAALGDADDHGEAIAIALTSVEGGVRVELSTRAADGPAQIDEALLARLRIGLRSMYGKNCSLDTHAGAQSLTITLFPQTRTSLPLPASRRLNMEVFHA